MKVEYTKESVDLMEAFVMRQNALLDFIANEIKKRGPRDADGQSECLRLAQERIVEGGFWFHQFVAYKQAGHK